jgi:hypothetical protein
MSPPARIRCRLIEETDIESATDLLTQGFPATTRNYWTNGFETLKTRPRPEGYPDYGYVLDADTTLVGVILLIFSQTGDPAHPTIRCNVSSWYVVPDYRTHATLLVSAAQKLKHVTYINISAAAHTWPIIEARGFRRYTEGQFAALPALSRGRGRARAFGADAGDLALPEHDLLQTHAAAGCEVLVCDTDQGPAPFVFVRRRIAYAPFGVWQLIWCRDTADFVRCAGPLGRRLLRQGVLCVLCDAEGPIAGLAGRFFKDRTPRFFKGPERPRMNDLTDTEIVLFGI